MSSVLVVVENDADFRRLIRLTLAEDDRIGIAGEAATAEEAEEQLAGAGAGLIVLDHYLDRGQRGIELAPRLKELAPEAKILLLSADDLAQEASHEPAIDAFLRKVDIEKLLPTAQELLGLEPRL